jgi:His/Glu/Gln/Arg/opine family amino acid ABC transporter permease subunit
LSFNIEYLLSVLPPLASAAIVNSRLAAIIVIIAMAGGTALTILQTLKIITLNAALNILISFIRGTPLLIQIFLFYYVMPSVGINLRPEVAGVAAISLNSSIFITIMMRSSLQGMDPGQIEAASALALSRRAIWQKVILPQLFRRILPLLVNEITIIIKGTALLSVITVVDVLRTAQQMAATSYKPFETLIGAALCFFVMNMAVMAIGSVIERRTAEART